MEQQIGRRSTSSWTSEGGERYCAHCLAGDGVFIAEAQSAQYCWRCGKALRALPPKWIERMRSWQGRGRVAPAAARPARGKASLGRAVRARPVRAPRIAVEAARDMLRVYREGSRRGVPNLELDARVERLFSRGLATDLSKRIDQLSDVGEYYGGVQARFVPGGYRAEAERIALAYEDSFKQHRRLLRAMPPLKEALPALEQVEELLRPFHASKFWVVWGSKFLQFLDQDVFPVLNSHVERVLGLRKRRADARQYHEFMEVMRSILLESEPLLAKLRPLAGDTGDSDLRLLDKLFWMMGREGQAGANGGAAG